MNSPDWRRIGILARREWVGIGFGFRALGVWVVFLLTYGMAVHQAHSFKLLAQFATVERALASMNALDLFLVPFAGILLGYTALAGEVESGTAQFLLSKPISRTTVVLGKFLGRTGYLLFVWALVTGGAVAWTLPVIRSMRVNAGKPSGTLEVLGSFRGVVLYPFSLFVLGVVFLALTLLASAWTRRTSHALSLGVAIYGAIALGWNSLVTVGASSSVAWIQFRLLNPFASWLEWSNRLLGQPSPWMQPYLSRVDPPYFVHSSTFLAIILLWLVICLCGAAWGLGRRDIP